MDNDNAIVISDD